MKTSKKKDSNQSKIAELSQRQPNSNRTFEQQADNSNYNNNTNTFNQELSKKVLVGKVNKLSGKGWSYNFRLLKMDQFGLSYYKNVPKDFDEQNLKCPSAENRTLKPKGSIPIKKIISINEIQEEDKKKFKKLAKAHDIAFKVIFSKSHLLKKEYVPGEDDDKFESDDDDMDQDEDDQDMMNGRTTMQQTMGNKFVKSKTKAKNMNKKAQNISSWYFVCENKSEQIKWIESLTISARVQNQKFIPDETLMDRLQIGKEEKPGIDGVEGADMDQDESDEEEEKHFESKKKFSNVPATKGKTKTGSVERKAVKKVIKEKQVSTNGKGNTQVQQIDLFKNNRDVKGDFEFNERSRTDSEFTDLNYVLQQNLNINNVNLDADGNINDINVPSSKRFVAEGQNNHLPGTSAFVNANQRIEDDDDGDQYFENNQDAKERLNKLKKNIERYQNLTLQLQDKKNKKEQKGWDLKFQNFWGYLVSADKNLKDNMNLSERFFDHVGKFRKTAQKIVRDIVDELHKPESLREKRPETKVPEEISVFLDDEDQNQGSSSTSRTLFYYQKNICIKLCHQGEQMMENNPLQNNINGTNNKTMGGNTSGMGGLDNNSYLTSNQQNKNADPFQNLKWKFYGREFLSMDVMFDTLYLLSKPDASHKLRVPLAAIVDYKGFRALAVASIPIQPQLGPSIGFYTDGKYVPHDQKLKQELVYVGDVLNLKENRISQKGQSQFESVPVSFFIKIYNYQQPESKNKPIEPNTPTQKSQEYHFSELQYLEEPFYVLKTSDIFPHDSDLNELYPRKDKYLRPEFVCTYERPLKADARKDLGSHVAKDTKSKDDENDQVDLNEASRYLRNSVIPNLVNLLDSLIIMPIDSESLEMTFHSQGVNMRYLGLVTSLSIVPHVIDICTTEMIARACKNILNKQIAAMVLDHQQRWVENEEKRENHKRQWNNRHLMSNASINAQNKRLNQLSQQTQQQEYDQKDQELQEEFQELNKSMDDSIKMAIVDYINLVFGAGEETNDFWNSILLPYTSQYYNFPFDDLQRANKFLNALFFTFISQCGIKIAKSLASKKEVSEFGRMNDRQGKEDRFATQAQKDDDFFKEFGKSEMPFGSPEKTFQRIELVGRSKTYGLRNLTYKLLADKYTEYKSEGKLENALKCCKMKRLMKRLLEDKEDISTIADICEIAFDHQEFKIAKEQAIEGLKNVHPLHAESIKFYCILMRSFYGIDFNQEADQYFSKALATLDHHWGPFHPLHSTIYGIMAYLLIQKNKMEEAKYLYQSSQLCCLRVLGPNHIQTAEVHMDFGRLYLKMKNKDESLQHFEQGYLIYESYFGHNALPTANAAMQIATILEEQGKLNDAFQYASISSETYRIIHGEESEQTIFAQFLQLSISYSLKHPEVVLQCKKLFDQLVKRDIAVSNISMIRENPRMEQQQQDFEEKIIKIKELCIAATILHMTRTLISEDKQSVKNYCDKVLFRAHQQKGYEEDNLPNLADLHQRIDQHKIMSLANLKFDDFGKKFLKEIYDNSKEPQYGGSIVFYYQKILDGVIAQARKEQKKASNSGTQYTKPSTLMEFRDLSSQGNQEIGNIQNSVLKLKKGIRELNTLNDNYVTDEPKIFFTNVIKAFEDINFYNVLVL